VNTSISGVVGILVAYNTPSNLLIDTVARLAPQFTRLLVMDNSTGDGSLERDLARVQVERVEYHSSGGNVGIADAQNRGITRAVQLGAEFVLFLDDDSAFPSGGVAMLLSELSIEREAEPLTVGIGPTVLDIRTGQCLAFVWDGARIRPTAPNKNLTAAYLVSSGALIDVKAFEAYGPLRSSYFIDHVDKEWGLRVGLNGGRLVVTNNVTMDHRLGDAPLLSSRGKVRYHHESPARDYYLTRNAILLMRDLRLPPAQQFGLVELLTKNAVRKIAGPRRTIRQRHAVLLGLIHGLANRRGPL
jgi:rhamnosyltransferase